MMAKRKRKGIEIYDVVPVASRDYCLMKWFDSQHNEHGTEVIRPLEGETVLDVFSWLRAVAMESPVVEAEAME